MPSLIKRIFWRTFNSINRKLKFPAVRKGDIVIQVGFDMSAPVTSDLFLLTSLTGKTGIVYGIEPDPFNCRVASEIKESNKLSLIIINSGTGAKKGETELLLGVKPGWNQINDIIPDPDKQFKDIKQRIKIDTLDNIVAEYNIDIKKIAHISLTINGSEYFSLLGMKNILSQAENISITAVAGRYDGSGNIDGVEDQVLITDILKQNNFTVRFKRIRQSFWWGFVIHTIIRRKRIENRFNYGIIMAAKGNRKLKWYQTFS